ncbi:hypothetical protein BDR07DRAFT_1412682 [Suillus spraguei]|nr:hypothetical protein BDR07DRAFT_1412682 [Suillus spraguei]
MIHNCVCNFTCSSSYAFECAFRSFAFFIVIFRTLHVLCYVCSGCWIQKEFYRRC